MIRRGVPRDAQGHQHSILVGTIVHITMNRSNGSTASVRTTRISEFQLDRMDNFLPHLPIAKRKLNPEWENQLRRSLSMRRGHLFELVFEDALASEGRESLLIAAERSPYFRASGTMAEFRRSLENILSS